MSTEDFTAESLVSAVRKLFEVNHYEVRGPFKLNGAEVDLEARRKNDPFSSPIFVEATIEYVDNEKYGKDLTKLMLLRETYPDSQLLIVSAKGFSAPVAERATNTRVRVLTYSELFSQFERFDPYVRLVTGDSEMALELQRLEDIYEEPLFEDQLGKEVATAFLERWRAESVVGWLVIVGEYGTGKTALTKIIQYRWMRDYQRNPDLPIPLRIELRDFTRQFDARGLLHHFLDHNGLGHVSIDFVYSLIRLGRVVLILDGYDEMAQYLVGRERRACLEALAELSAGGARGILTSRPNYFTEAEELHVFDALYSSLKADRYYLGRETRALIERETIVDNLLKQFLDRFERSLQDLDEEKTVSLVKRILSDDPAGQQAVLNVLRRIFRSVGFGDSKSLSGKPVIISYLLEIVEDLRGGSSDPVGVSEAGLTEWQAYKLIIDHLMIRDLRRSPEFEPRERRHFLHKLGMFLSRSEHSQISEKEFKDLILKEFSSRLRRHDSDTKNQIIERYFADLRSSSTLTRSSESSGEGWRFSHNSLREYLVAEYLLLGLESGSLVHERVSVSDAMRQFAASRYEPDLRNLLELLAGHWRSRVSERGCGQLLTLLWDGFLRLFSSVDDPVSGCLGSVCGRSLTLDNIDLRNLQLSVHGRRTNLSHSIFAGSDLASVNFSGADLTSADFSNSTLDSVIFAETELKGAQFGGSTIDDSSFLAANLVGADFQGVDPGEISIIVGRDGEVLRLQGLDALGFLRFNGALTDVLPPSVVLQHHPKFLIVDKIMSNLEAQRIHQRRGIEQRGEARKDIPFARRFVEILEADGLIKVIRRRNELIEVTGKGRELFHRFASTGELPKCVVKFLEGM